LHKNKNTNTTKNRGFGAFCSEYRAGRRERAFYSSGACVKSRKKDDSFP